MVDNLDTIRAAALQLLLRGGAALSAPPPPANPYGTHDLAALITLLGADAAAPKKKRRKSKFNRLVAKHMKLEGKKHPKSAAKIRFKRAVSKAKKELKRGKTKHR